MKHAVITGAANGIGEALPRRFVRAGYSVTGVDIDAKGGANLAREIGARFVFADLSCDAGIARAHDQLVSMVPIDVLIHNAGINAVGRFSDVSLEAQERVTKVNFYAPMAVTARLLEANRIVPGGFLVFVSSLPLHKLSGGRDVRGNQERAGVLFTKSLGRTCSMGYACHDGLFGPYAHRPCPPVQPGQFARGKTHAPGKIGGGHLSRHREEKTSHCSGF